ncbi:hypothetical protein [Mycobacterium avium]|uniref:Lipoprotein n=2 Tax=Mycobacterium TaxID=1763 RepID=A0AA37PYI9_9MYCO|nr:hypothetical protein [Mycobacterium avium]ATQ40891.2 hypothetical protein KV38_26220 [Mycobacterium avium subsp. hominissuis]GLB86831.1 hypothetical protein SRL2020028_60870 [Mycobacterium kiyosense]
MVRFTSQAVAATSGKVGPAAAMLAAVTLTALTGCSSGDHPAAGPATTSTAAAPTTSGPRTAPVTTRRIVADTLTIGTTGIRCFVGNTSAACAATTRPFKDGDHSYWTATFSFTAPIDLEPGFEPGQIVDPTRLAVGDIAVTGGTIGVITAMGKTPQVGVRSQVVDIREIADGRNDFDGFYHPDAGKSVTPGSPVTIRDWKFTLNGTSLVIDTPNGGHQLDI